MQCGIRGIPYKALADDAELASTTENVVSYRVFFELLNSSEKGANLFLVFI
jgi:hypothetical protein